MSDVEFDRAILVKGMILPEVDIARGRAPICNARCAPQIQPKLTSEHGKVVKGRLNWGKIEAAKLATALSPATGRQFLGRIAPKACSKALAWTTAWTTLTTSFIPGAWSKGAVAGQVTVRRSPRWP